MTATTISNEFERPRDVRMRELATDIVGAAYLRGDFVLSSGLRSNYYFDKYLFETKPSILRRVSEMLVELVPADVDRIAGPELGAVALATGLSLSTGLPFVIVRKAGKDYGTSRLVEGELFAGDRVLLVEDVISTGAQAISAAQQVALTGAEVAGVIGVIDREQGGAQNIAAEGYHYQALFTRTDLGI
jgi:orotate phosphoribosyltransferase